MNVAVEAVQTSSGHICNCDTKATGCGFTNKVTGTTFAGWPGFWPHTNAVWPSVPEVRALQRLRASLCVYRRWVVGHDGRQGRVAYLSQPLSG